MQPQFHRVDGVWREFHGTGALALATGRAPGTIRRWEALGVLPPPRHQRSTATWGGRRRLYTRGEIAAIVSVVVQQKLLDRRPQELRSSGLRTHIDAQLAAARQLPHDRGRNTTECPGATTS